MEERRGHRLLTTLAGLFVSNSDEVIQIDLSPLESGWEIMGSNIKVRGIFLPQSSWVFSVVSSAWLGSTSIK